MTPCRHRSPSRSARKHRIGEWLNLEARVTPATFTVTNPLDSHVAGQVNLREAVAAANADYAATHAAETIQFGADLARHTLPLSLAGDNRFGPSALLVTGNVTINGGAGGMTIARDGTAGTPLFRLFAVPNGASLTLQNLTLRDGVARGASGAGGFGGAVFNAGTLTVRNSTFTANTARGCDATTGGPSAAFGASGGYGGGGPAGGGAGAGGGIFNQGGSVSLTNATFADNTAVGGNGNGTPGGGGGAGLGGAFFNLDGGVTATFCTFAYNSVIAGVGGLSPATAGGSLYNLSLDLSGTPGAPAPLPGTTATVVLDKCILAATTGGLSDVANQRRAGTATLTATAPNLVQDVQTIDGATTNTSGLVVGFAQLGLLHDNGGSAPTIALLPGSSALNAGGPSTGAPPDQRGVIRTGKPQLDLGAFAALTNPLRLFAVGTAAGTAGLVKVYNGDGSLRYTLTPYPGYAGGVQVAVGDVLGSGHDYVITVPGANAAPEVHVYDGPTGNLVSVFDAYDPRFYGGIQVALGDTSGQGFANIITVPGRGGSPEVRVFNAHGTLLSDYNAYDVRFTGGIQVAVADTLGHGYANVITVPQRGGSPEVRVFDGQSPVITATGMGVPNRGDFNAYDVRFTGGITVAAGDTAGHGYASILTAPGRGGSPEVHVYDGRSLGLVSDFNAYDVRFTGGITLTAADALGRGYLDIVTAPGAGGSPEVRVFDGKNPSISAVGNGSPDYVFNAYPTSYTGGITLLARDVAAAGYASIVTVPGAGTSADVRLFDPIKRQLRADFVAFDPAFLGGVFLA